MPSRRERGLVPDDEDARKERAAHLRERIEEIIEEDPAPDDERDGDESPRDFVHRRMKELRED